MLGVLDGQRESNIVVLSPFRLLEGELNISRILTLLFITVRNKWPTFEQLNFSHLLMISYIIYGLLSLLSSKANESLIFLKLLDPTQNVSCAVPVLNMKFANISSDCKSSQIFFS